MSWAASPLRWVGLTASMLVGVAVGSACSNEPLTQIVVVVDSDWDGFARLEIQIDGFTHGATIEAKLDDKPLPRRVALVHDGGPLGPLSVTVRSFVPGMSDPVVSEPRTRVFFEQGKTRMLRIELLFECIGRCGSGMACVAGPRCVASDSRSRLVDWTGDPQALDTVYHVKQGDVLGADTLDAALNSNDGSLVDAASTSADTGVSTQDGSAALGDARTVTPAVAFSYAPANLVATAPELTALEHVAVQLDCGQSEFDSSDLSFTHWCGAEPKAIVIDQGAGIDAAVIVMSTLSVASGSSLRLKGSRPVIFAVFGDAQIDGTIDGGARGSTPGAGADRSCGGGNGSSGTSTTSFSSSSAGGGSGGGFGSQGGAGGSGQASTAVAGGVAGGNLLLSPLRGGCSGGRGGVAGSQPAASSGGGGGAVQISVAGRLSLSGVVSVGGGGGGVGAAQQLGGGGGGSGGGILLEAAQVDIQSNAVISANGGGGGAGQPRSPGTLNPKPGEDGAANAVAAAGSPSSSFGGGGGAGAALSSEAMPGSGAPFGVGGGGGGGGVGRIRINQAHSCVPAGVISPSPSVSCGSCGVCPAAPALGCEALDYGGRVYYRCSVPLALQTARTRCQAVGLDLIDIEDSAENSWLSSQLARETWLGASDSTRQGTWVWLRSGAVFWTGGDRGVRAPGAFAAWSVGEPMNSSAGMQPQILDCATIGTDGSWSARACDATYSYVCE